MGGSGPSCRRGDFRGQARKGRKRILGNGNSTGKNLAVGSLGMAAGGRTRHMGGDERGDLECHAQELW